MIMMRYRSDLQTGSHGSVIGSFDIINSGISSPYELVNNLQSVLHPLAGKSCSFFPTKSQDLNLSKFVRRHSLLVGGCGISMTSRLVHTP